MKLRATGFMVLFLAFQTGLYSTQAPRLVVVISIDQLRYDYLERFSDHFGEGGFNLFLKSGANFANTNYRHSVTATGAGHAVILSGSHGNSNGIISNHWLDPETLEDIYCVADRTAIIIDADDEAEGRSPRNFIGNTVGDQLKLATAGRSRVISVAHKDRSAILMGGKLADGAFWLRNGDYVTSDYYQKILPKWVEKFNKLDKVESYFGQKWEKLLPEEAYASQGADYFLGERATLGLGRTFPKTFDGGAASIGEQFYHAFFYSPFGNTVLAEFAKAAVTNEKLGQREETDLLCIGFSANDAIGHLYGPDSHEVLDITVRTDRVLEDFFGFLDEKLGLENCTIVLTADHGVAPLPEKILLANDRFPAGRIDEKVVLQDVENALVEAFGPLTGDKSWVEVSYDQIYFYPAALTEKHLASGEVENFVQEYLEKKEFIQAVYTRTELEKGEVTGKLGHQALLSFHKNRSGSVFYQLKPFYVRMPENGANHSSPHSYDTHVPLFWYGVGVTPGTYTTSTGVSDLAPTLSYMLGLDAPVLSTGRILF